MSQRDTYDSGAEAEADRTQKKALLATHRIVIEPTSIRGERGQYYRVYFGDGVLIEDTWNPEFEACRALVARGVTGRLEVWRPSAAGPGLIRGLIFPDIEEGARWTVVENEKEGPVIRRWVPYPDHLHHDAVSASTRLSPVADLRPGGRVTHPQVQEPVFDAGPAK